MPDVLQVPVPADLILPLHRAALDRYSLAAERVSAAADAHLGDERDVDLRTAFRAERECLRALGDVLESLEEDLDADETEEGVRHPSCDGARRDAVLDALDWLLDTDDLDHADPERIVETGKLFERLLPLRAQLAPEAVTA
jgi:hypothetical protein